MAAFVKVSRLALLGLAVAGVIMTANASAVELHGHRGARGLLPENTIAGFLEAIRLGVTCIETDIGLTRDGKLIIHHDRSLNTNIARRDDRWIDAPVPLFSLNTGELEKYDVGRLKPGSDYAARYPRQRHIDGAKIPLLTDLISLPEIQSSPSICLNIEIKTSPLATAETAPPEKIVEALVALLDTHKFRKRVRVQSFDWRNLIHLRRMAPDVALSFLTAEQPWLDNLLRSSAGSSPWLAGSSLEAFAGSVPKLIKHLGGKYWAPFHRDISAGDVAAAHAEGLHVIVWTVNDAADMDSALQMGVDGIITDYPDIGRNVIDNFKKPQ